MTYKVSTFTSYAAAVKRAVRALAPLPPAGRDPRLGGRSRRGAARLPGLRPGPGDIVDFTVRYVYLTDPLKRDALRNARITFTNFVTGALKYRLRKYRQTDSPTRRPVHGRDRRRGQPRGTAGT